MKQEFEYIVLGLGGIGSGAAYWLARRAGSEVLGIEQFELGHHNGGSQDHSRIVRLSYDNEPSVRLAQRAFECWAELEQDANEELIILTGGIDLWPADSPVAPTNNSSSLAAAGVPYELLNGAEVMQRFPHFVLPDSVEALYQETAGIAAAAKCNAAHQRMARAHGATLLENTPVEAVRPLSDGFEVVASSLTYRCKGLVVAAGGWTNQVLQNFGQHLPLNVTQEQVTYFAAPDLEPFQPDNMPIWIWHGPDCFYGLQVYGEPGPKVGQHAGGRSITPQTRTFDRDEAAYERVVAFLQAHIPDMVGPPLYTKSCLYTQTPDHFFVLDTLPDLPNCAIAVGAGHAFKHASAMGRVLSELVMDGSTPTDLASFRFDRPALQTTGALVEA